LFQTATTHFVLKFQCNRLLLQPHGVGLYDDTLASHCFIMMP